MIDFDLLLYLQQWSSALVGPVALIIGLISLRGFVLVRSWKFLLLSVAFLLLSITPLLQLLGFLNLLDSSLFPALIILESQSLRYVIPTIAFLLLALVYSDELRTATIRINRNGWIVFGILVATYPVLAILALTNVDNPDPFIQQMINSLIPSVIDGWICYTLVLIAIFALYAHYRVKKKKYTLVTLIGFFFILLGQLAPLLWIFEYRMQSGEWPMVLYFVLIGPITLFGFILILVAIVGARVSNG
jgi:hypothetical protein